MKFEYRTKCFAGQYTNPEALQIAMDKWFAETPSIVELVSVTQSSATPCTTEPGEEEDPYTFVVIVYAVEA